MAQYGVFFVQMESYNYSPGQQVSGQIFLDLRVNFPAACIIMKLEGKEKTKFWKSKQVYSHTDSNGTTHYRTEWYAVYGRHRILHYDFPVANFNGGFIPAGQYTIPFTFALPHNIPNTFRHDWHDPYDCHARIHYEIKAKLEQNSGNGNDLLKFKQPFSVNAQLTGVASNKATETDKEVVCCCCCSKGRCKITGYFEKDAYQPNEIAYMVSEVQNETSVNINSLQAVFHQRLWVEAHGWWGSHNKSWERNLATVNGRSYQAKESSVGQNAERLAVPLKGLEIKRGDDAGTIGGYNTTTHGKLIRCDFFISARTEMDTLICCDEHPAATIPILVYHENKPTQSQWVAPPSWAPTAMDMYTANLTSAYQAPEPVYPEKETIEIKIG